MEKLRISRESDDLIPERMRNEESKRYRAVGGRSAPPSPTPAVSPLHRETAAARACCSIGAGSGIEAPFARVGFEVTLSFAGPVARWAENRSTS